VVLVPFLTVVVKFQPVVKASHSCIFLYPSIFLISSFPNLPARRTRKCQINTIFPAISIPLLRASAHTVVRCHCLLCLLSLTMPTSIQTAEPTTISRTHACAKKAPKLVTNKTFTFWRRRTSSHKLRNRVFTVGDRRVQAQKRASQRHEYLEAVQAAQGKIQELADGMRNRFGKHSAAHYYNDLIHRAHRSRNTRRVSPWNAYQKRELARMKSKSPHIYNAIVTHPTCFQVNAVETST